MVIAGCATGPKPAASTDAPEKAQTFGQAPEKRPAKMTNIASRPALDNLRGPAYFGESS
jgi:hypothetical protein